MHRHVAVIGVAIGAGAGNPGCADAPDQLRAAGILADLDFPVGSLVWETILRPGAAVSTDRLATVASLAGQLADRVKNALGRGDFPLVIGGDHSIAIGTWSGVGAALAAGERCGLIWIDAHLDSHTFATTPSRNIHGMALASLLGHGAPELTGIGSPGPKLHPADVCIIGARSFETEELRLLQNLGVRIYFMPEVRRRGTAVVMAEAIGRVTRQARNFGISFDVDALDPVEEAGTGTPVPGGLFKKDVLDALAPWHADRRLIALEIVEYNPHLDRGHATARAVHDLCSALL